MHGITIHTLRGFKGTCSWVIYCTPLSLKPISHEPHVVSCYATSSSVMPWSGALESPSIPSVNEKWFWFAPLSNTWNTQPFSSGIKRNMYHQLNPWAMHGNPRPYPEATTWNIDHSQRMNVEPYHYLTPPNLACTSAWNFHSYPEGFEREPHHYH